MLFKKVLESFVSNVYSFILYEILEQSNKY